VNDDRPTPVTRCSASERPGLEFLAEFLETAIRHRPDNVEALAELGHVYTRLGRLGEGLGVDRLLVRLVPDNPTVHYNLACSLALSGAAKEALDALETAVQLGYADADFLVEDGDLESLRAHPRFAALLQKLASRPA
jgi:tetratricopeptide (TPR) repeat protein